MKTPKPYGLDRSASRRDAVLTDPCGEPQRLFFETCYLFDLVSNGKAVAYRAPGKTGDFEEDLRAEMTAEEWEIVRSYLLRMPTRPLVCRAGGRVALLIPTLAGSASLGLFLFPCMDEDRFLRLAKRDDERVELAPGLLGESIRLSAKTKALLPIYDGIIEEAEACFGNTDLFRDLDEGADITEALEERVERLALFCGTPVSLKRTKPIERRESLDFPLLCAFVVLILLLIRRIGLKREAEIVLQPEREGCSVSIRTEIRKQANAWFPEVLCLEQIAARKNLLFEWSIDDPRFSARMLPISPEWSYLGLKQEMNTLWPEEDDRAE